MATISGVSSSLPAAGGEILAEPLTDTFNAIINFIQGSNIDEDNVNLSATNGIVGKSTAQTLTGLKTFTVTDVGGSGVSTAIQIALDPASGTPVAGDGPRALFLADDASGNSTTIGEIRALWVTPTHGATEAAKVDIYARAANASVLGMSLNGGIFSGLVNFGIGGAAINRGFVTIDPIAFEAITTVNIARLNIENTAAITVPAGTTAIAASVFIGEPNLTATGTITSAVTVYIEAAPTEGGTNNYALWVDSGATKLDGTLRVDGITTVGDKIVSDTDSTDDLGTTSVRFANVFTDSIGDSGQALTVDATELTFVSTIPVGTARDVPVFVRGVTSIADDGVATLINGRTTMATILLTILNTGGGTGVGTCLLSARCASSPSGAIIVQGGSITWAVTTSDVSGTTGVDGQVTISCRDGILEIENRAGEAMSISIMVLAST